MISVHADSAHKSSVSRTEFELQNGFLDERLDRIETKLDHLLERNH